MVKEGISYFWKVSIILSCLGVLILIIDTVNIDDNVNTIGTTTLENRNDIYNIYDRFEWICSKVDVERKYLFIDPKDKFTSCIYSYCRDTLDFKGAKEGKDLLTEDVASCQEICLHGFERGKITFEGNLPSVFTFEQGTCTEETLVLKNITRGVYE